MTQEQQIYWQGFMDKCAELGIDGNELLKFAQPPAQQPQPKQQQPVKKAPVQAKATAGNPNAIGAPIPKGLTNDELMLQRNKLQNAQGGAGLAGMVQNLMG